MSRLTDIKQRIDQLDGGAFQELCDAYLHKLGYSNIVPLGMKSGTHKTTKGTPDTYFTTVTGRYILVMYTTQKLGLFDKIYNDIKDCFNKDKTGLSSSDILEIIYCHTSSSITAGQDKELKSFCEEKNVLLKILGLDLIASDIYNKYHAIARDLLGVPISTDQIFTVAKFVENYNANALAASLDTQFQFREKEIKKILDALENSNVIIISGQAGVGKTRLALESARQYLEIHGGHLYCIRSNSLPVYEDLKVFLGTPDKYLLMVDDANQITGLEHIIQYSIKQHIGYTVKVIITVREYARNDVLRERLAVRVNGNNIHNK